MANERNEEQLIEKLRSRYDLTNSKDVLTLYSMLQSGEYEFHTQAGMRFDDEIYDLAMEAKKQQEHQAGKKSKDVSDTGTEKKDKKRKRQPKVVVYTRGEYLARKILLCVLALIMTGCFGYFAYYNYEAYQKNLQTESLNRLKENDAVNDMYGDTIHEVTDEETGEVKTFTVLDQYKSLYNKNKNLIGWIKIDDTIIDYPVMQTADNEFYLDHDIDQKQDKNGTLFLDAACDITLPSTNYIIYGHNMRSGKMFGSLSKYESEKYYEDHPYIQFDTIYEEGVYEVMYAFRSKIYNEDEVVFKYYQFIEANSEEEFDSNMKEMAALSLYDTGVEAVYGDHLLTLSTCDYEEKDGRFVVVAKQIR